MTRTSEIATWQPVAALTTLALLLAWETARPFFPFFKGERSTWKKRGRHGALNLALGIFNAALTGLIFSSIWFAATRWGAQQDFGILRWLPLPVWAQWLGAILMLDAWTYFWHRINHVVPFFWRFHRWHHLDEAMDVTTASRFHSVEIIFSSILRVPVLLLIGCTIEQLALYELLLFVVVQFHHANIALPDSVDRFARALIVTPFVHKVHHSVALEDRNSNYSSLFSWWDRMFRTFKRRDNPAEIVFGVDP